ncbi:MAG: enoyl-CoA hydratase/isomerase family protein [Hyphomicrobium sp.]
MTTRASGASDAAASASDEKVIITRRGALVVFTLNRPKALNAFDEDMRRVIADEIPKIARNPDVYIVGLAGAGPKAFCAGGDVRALTALARTDLPTARRYFANEYTLDWLLDCFSKPTVSLINGICMGSGVGLSSFNTHRVAGENYKYAMPEAAIGLFPDVGVAHVLARLPWPIGLYLGLTGRAIGRGDAYALGLITHCIDGAHHASIFDALAAAEPVDPLLDGLHRAVDAGPLMAERALIEEFFSHASLDGIVAALASATGSAEKWAKTTLSDLMTRSPMSLKITDQHIRLARVLDLRQTLIQDYRLAYRCLEAPDFAEGVRAALIDKDGHPKWSPATLADVTDAAVAHYFAPLGADDLVLPSRVEMQAARY